MTSELKASKHDLIVNCYIAPSTIYTVIIDLNATNCTDLVDTGQYANAFFTLNLTLWEMLITQVTLSYLQKYRKTLGKIHAKEDRVLDLDDVLKYADANADGKIDFDEWRQDLIK